MAIFAGVMAVIFALGTVEEKNNRRQTTYALCFCVSMVVMLLA